MRIENEEVFAKRLDQVIAAVSKDEHYTESLEG